MSAFDVVIAVLEQIQDDVLDVFTDVTGFGQRRCVRHSERYVQELRQGLREQGLTGTGRTDQKNVRLRKLDAVFCFFIALMLNALVVVVNRDRKNTLRAVLTDDVIIERGFDLSWLRNFFRRTCWTFLLAFFSDDVVTKLDAFIADIDRRSCDQLLHFALVLTAEGAAEITEPVPVFLSVHLVCPQVLACFSTTRSISPYSAASLAER